MINFQQAVEKLNALGIRRIPGGFDGITPCDDFLQDGDIIIIPENFEVFRQEFPSGVVAQFLLAPNQDGKLRRIYPQVFTKSINTVDQYGNDAGKLRASGSAVEVFRSKTTIDEAMHAIAGHPIKVSETKAYASKFPGHIFCTSVYNFDFE